MTTETATPTADQLLARRILARIDDRGVSIPAELTGKGVARVDTEAFARAWQLLSRGGLVQVVGSRQVGRSTVPTSKATLQGRRLARHLPPEARA